MIASTQTKETIMRTLMRMLVAMAVCACVHAQDNRELMRSVMRDDSEYVDVLAMADDDVQTAWLVASSAGEAVARLSTVQGQSQGRFTALAQGYTRETQADMWNVSRYTAVVERLSGAPVSDAELDALVAGLPGDVQQSVRRLLRESPSVFAKMNDIRWEFERGYEEVVRSYPDSVRRAFTTLRTSPEVLSLMNDNMRSTVLMGDLYKRDARTLRDALKERNRELLARKAGDVREWQNKLDADADARKELQQSAAEFAQEEGRGESDMVAITPPAPVRVVSYAYWTGFPWWYASPIWYPYPLWYHTGYAVVGGRWVWCGTPSWYFLRWHFRHHRHISSFPHLTNIFLDFWLFGPPRFNPWCRWETRYWYRFHQPRFAPDFRSDRSRRIERLRSFGPDRDVPQRPSDPPRRRDPGRPEQRPVKPLQPMSPPATRPSTPSWTPPSPPRQEPTSPPRRAPVPDRAPVPPPPPPRMPNVRPRPTFSPQPKEQPAPSRAPSSEEKPPGKP
ncbi:MAG: hypothetical protein ACKO9V_05160 [Candidatus Kapaibacterium sp.]